MNTDLACTLPLSTEVCKRLEALNKLRTILGLEEADEDVYQEAQLCMERLALF